MRNLMLVMLLVGASSLANQNLRPGLHDAVYRTIAVHRPDALVTPQMVHLVRQYPPTKLIS